MTIAHPFFMRSNPYEVAVTFFFYPLLRKEPQEFLLLFIICAQSFWTQDDTKEAALLLLGRSREFISRYESSKFNINREKKLGKA